MAAQCRNVIASILQENNGDLYDSETVPNRASLSEFHA